VLSPSRIFPQRVGAARVGEGRVSGNSSNLTTVAPNTGGLSSAVGKSPTKSKLQRHSRSAIGVSLSPIPRSLAASPATSHARWLQAQG
jgi:hypothetical protein